MKIQIVSKRETVCKRFTQCSCASRKKQGRTTILYLNAKFNVFLVTPAPTFTKESPGPTSPIVWNNDISMLIPPFLLIRTLLDLFLSSLILLPANIKCGISTTSPSSAQLLLLSLSRGSRKCLRQRMGNYSRERMLPMGDWIYIPSKLAKMLTNPIIHWRMTVPWTVCGSCGTIIN